MAAAVEQIASLENTIKSPNFPESEDADKEMSRNLDDALKIVGTPDVVKVWGNLISLLRTICLHNNVKNMPETVSNCRGMAGKLKRDLIEKNATLFETWAPVGAEILQNFKGDEKVAYVISEFICELRETRPPKNGHDKLWIPVLLSVTSWTNKDLLDSAARLLREDHLKRMWKWKDNLADAKKVIVNIGKLDLPLEEGDGFKVRDMVSAAGNIVELLVEMLELYKVHSQVQEELADLTINLMEKRSPFLSYNIAKECTSQLFLKKNQHLVPGLLQKFLTMYKDDDYPWEDSWCSDTGDNLVNKCIEAYENGKEIKDDAKEAFLDIFKYACQPDHELVVFEHGDMSIHGHLLHRMQWYVMLFSDPVSLKKVVPLLPYIFDRIMTLEEGEHEDSIKQSFSAILGQMSNYSSESMAQYLDKVVAWYLKEPGPSLAGILQCTYPHNPEAIAEKFDELVEAFVQDEGGYVLHCLMLKSVIEKQPELFNEENFGPLMEHHWMHEHANSGMVMAVEKLVETRADLMEPHFVDKVLNNDDIQPMVSSFIVKIILCVVANFEEYKDPVLEYFIKTLKSSKDDHQIHSILNGLRGFVSLFGPEKVRPHTDLIKNFKVEGGTMYIKDSATALVDDMEGRSLEKVSKDVEENKGDIENLQIGLAGTKLIVRRVSKTVMKHDKQIKKTKEELKAVDQRVDVVNEDLEETKGKVEEIDMKTMSNAPKWSRDVTKLMNVESDHDWRLLASRLGYSPDDIRGWATQSDPCMALLSEWYATHKTVEATHGVLVALQEMNRLDAAVIVENAMKAAEGVVADEPVNYPEPPEIFLSYQWGHQNEVKLIQRHLEMAGYKCWMDVGQMGGGDKLFEKIDSGIRAAKVIICCVTEKYAKSPNCIREVNLSVNLGKPIIPLLLEKMSWPPKGSMGPIFSEYLFIRFFQRKGEETDDDRIWPVPKFQELLMQLNYLKIMPEEDLVTEEYKNWWIPVVEEIIIQKKDGKPTETARTGNSPTPEVSSSPDVFISYQWGKQKEISALYQRLTSLGFTCWMDIHQMGGGDSLYDKIDRGVRGCKVMLSSITQKYALSANCRREVSLADAVKKPIIPLLMEKCDWPPSGPMSMVFTQLLFINFSKDESVQLRWDGAKFDELLQKLHVHVPIASNEAHQNEDSTTRKEAQDPKDERVGEKPVKEEQPKSKVSSVAAVASGASATDSNTVNGETEKTKKNTAVESQSKIHTNATDDTPTTPGARPGAPHARSSTSQDGSVQNTADKKPERNPSDSPVEQKKSSTCAIL